MSDTSLKRSLAQDDVDWYNNTFAFIFLLLLGVFTLLLPLTPTLNGNNNNNNMALASKSSALAESLRRPTSPKVSLTCWGPSHFEDLNHVRYMDTFCAQVMESKLRGIGGGHGIYQAMEDKIRPWIRSDGQFQEGQLRPADDDSDKKRKQQQQQQLIKNETVRKKLQDLVYYQAPLVFLLMALVFEAAYVLCSLMRNALPSCIDVDQILDTFVISRSLNLASQTQILEETAEVVAKSIKSSRNAASTSYLISKVLNTLIVLVAVCFIGGVVLADVNSMIRDLTGKETPPHEINTKQDSRSHSESGPFPNGNGNGSSSNHTRTLNNVVHCFFRIRQLKTAYGYTVQCVVNHWGEEDESRNHLGTAARHANAQVTQTTADSNTQNALFIYQALFSVALAFLVFLLVANLISTISWVRRLFVKSNATSTGLPSNATRDVVFLVHMASLNVGPLVARGLARSPVWSNSFEEMDREPILEVETEDH